MANSIATVTVPDLDIGPCRITYDSQDLGASLDNVKVMFKYKKAPLKADQYGDTLLDEAISGMECSVETSIAMVRNYDILQKLFKFSTYATDVAKKALTWEDKIANRSEPLSAQLVLHPLIEADASLNFDWIIYKAVLSEESEIIQSPGEQMKFKAVWHALLDLSTTPARLFRRGDGSVA